jgi:hypothetical protein
MMADLVHFPQTFRAKVEKEMAPSPLADYILNRLVHYDAFYYHLIADRRHIPYQALS